MAGFTVNDFHHNVTTLLSQANPNLPLFIYGHSMGGLTVLSYLINNPNLNISGVILSAPFLGFHPSQGIDSTKAALVRIVGHELEVISSNCFFILLGLRHQSKDPDSSNLK